MGETSETSMTCSSSSLRAASTLPWSATPNELTSLLWIQCTLFFQLNVFVWSMLDTEFGLIQHKHFPDEWLIARFALTWRRSDRILCA